MVLSFIKTLNKGKQPFKEKGEEEINGLSGST